MVLLRLSVVQFRSGIVEADITVIGVGGPQRVQAEGLGGNQAKVGSGWGSFKGVPMFRHREQRVEGLRTRIVQQQGESV